jgi:anaerobic magnesium-protoporphyrin IX monomethyl ester cyclase
MKVLIVNSPLFKKYKNQNEEDFLPPIGLGYIATYLKNQNIEVELLDAVALKVSLRKLKSTIQQYNPEFLAINIFSTNYSLVKEFIESIKTKTHIIIGGLSTKALYQKLIEWESSNQIDVIIGDGELIIIDIVNNAIKEPAFIQTKNRRVFNVTAKSIYFNKDISTVRLDRFFFKNEPLINAIGVPEINLVTSRGCIYNCSFCAAARSLNI